MLIVLPIRTESAIHRPPTVNYALIGINFLCFFALNEQFSGPAAEAFKQKYFCLHAYAPSLHEFFAYQFMHATPSHILGNMLFLWVFGNSVNSKMGHLSYLAFYLAGGIFAGWGWATLQTGGSVLLGASGAVAAVTTAYLALFPRSHVTVLVWFFFFLHFFEWPAMILILLKIIVWDNIVGPTLVGSGNVAHTAHLAGYLFGFTGALLMLLIRGVQRDQFDILALWSRWQRRREFATILSAGGSGSGGRGEVVRRTPMSAAQARTESARLDQLAAHRTAAMTLIDQGRDAEAATAYQQLVELDPAQCLSERGQLAVARALYAEGLFDRAAHAFERFLDCYARSPDALEVRLLLGIIYARDLKRLDEAEAHLSQALEQNTDERRKAQCAEWLSQVRAARLDGATR